MKQHRPDLEIAAGNPWYLADQHRAQMGSGGRRRVIERRWQVFADMVGRWRERRRSATPAALTVLDAGCGDGINLFGLRTVAERHGLNMRLFGVDYNPVRLARARRVDADVRLQQGSLYRLPFADASFDVVLCNHVIEHVPDTPSALAELHRVLRRGGLLIVGVPNEGCLLGRARNHVIQPWIGRTTDHVHFFTVETVSETLRTAGFDVRQIERETFFFPCSYLNTLCTEFDAGHLLMAGLRRLAPSQAGGLIVASERPVYA